MRTSSANVLDDAAEASTLDDGVLPTTGFAAQPASREAGSATAPSVPRFVMNARAMAATSRMAGRINATAVTDDEHGHLLRERQTLLDKKLDGTITKQELNKLEYIRWSLDRIEDAKYGYQLDQLESFVQQYESFTEGLASLKQQLESFLNRRG